MSAEQKIQSLGLTLPPAPKPAGVYRPLLIDGDLVYVSGHGPVLPDETMMTGRIGADVGLEEGIAAARQTGLAILATLRAELTSLDRIDRVIKVLGMVNAAADFKEHPKVINGCSQLFADVFTPERGIGARSAVGMGSLPGNISVEIEAVFRVSP